MDRDSSTFQPVFLGKSLCFRQHIQTLITILYYKSIWIRFGSFSGTFIEYRIYDSPDAKSENNRAVIDLHAFILVSWKRFEYTASIQYPAILLLCNDREWSKTCPCILFLSQWKHSHCVNQMLFDTSMNKTYIRFLLILIYSVNSCFHSFWTFSEVKKHFSETRKDVIGKKLLGSNRPYMSYPMKFCFYLHQAYGYWHN